MAFIQDYMYSAQDGYGQAPPHPGKKGRQARGFTLIESLIALMLVALALVSLVKIVSFTSDEHNRSRTRFAMLQALQNEQHLLASKAFASDELRPGLYQKREGQFKITRHIGDLTSDLKKIQLKISRGILETKLSFYKSRFIKETAND